MKKAAAKTTTKLEDGSKVDVDGMAIALQFLDTTWRVALPIIILTYIGIRLDKYFVTNPLYTVLGLFLALSTATTLVYVQIKNAYPDFMKKGKK